MKHTTETSILRASTAAFLLMGLAVIVAAHSELYLSNLPAQVSSFEDLETPYSGGAAMETIHPSAPPDAAIVAMTEKQLAFGMLMVVAALFMHLLFKYRHGFKTAVTTGPKKAPVKPAFSMK
jgi:hypothetical protein